MEYDLLHQTGPDVGVHIEGDGEWVSKHTLYKYVVVTFIVGLALGMCIHAWLPPSSYPSLEVLKAYVLIAELEPREGGTRHPTGDLRS